MSEQVAPPVAKGEGDLRTADQMEAEALAEVRGIEQAMRARAEAAFPERSDPLRLYGEGLAAAGVAHVRAMSKLTTATIARIGNLLTGVRAAPLAPEERADLARELVDAARDGARDGANAGMRAEARRMIRTLDRGLAVRVGLGVGGAYVAGALTVLGVLMAVQLGPFSRGAEAGAAWRDLVQHNPDPRPALASAETRTDHASGRRYYAGVSLWLDPPRPPPAVSAKQ